MSELTAMVQEAQTSEEYFARLVEEWQGSILSCASRVVNHYVSKSDDEWSVALIAFHEAVQSYDREKGDFRAFSGLIIRRRLLDYLKREYRHAKEIPVEPQVWNGDYRGEEEAGRGNGSEALRRTTEEAADTDWPGRYTAADEVEALQGQLRKYGFSFFDIADSTPRSRKTRESCARAAAVILESPERLDLLRSTGLLPVTQLSRESGVPKKVLERHRRYIIAAVVILSGNYPMLAEYMQFIRKAVVK